MSTDERLDRLERRLAVLEGLVREMMGKEPVAERPAPRPAPAVAPPSPSRPAIDAEEWLGQRGLLALGVVALILAAGYLLKLSFDRGWISPAVRCAGGFLAGAAVGAIGWRLEPKYRTYGTALIGCGAAIMYLVVWAATSVYEFFPPVTGIAGLALVSLALAAIAFAFDVEWLATVAALGAFFAPVLLGRNQNAADRLLLYLACMAAGFGWVAAAKRWRLAAFVVGASFFGLASPVRDGATPGWLIIYAVAGGAGGLYLGLREGWWETRFLSFWGGWGLAAAASDGSRTQIPLLFAALALAAPVWWHGLRHPLALPHKAGTTNAGLRSLGESLYFLVTPILVGWAIHRQSPNYFHAHRGLAPLLVALPYLAVGYLRPFPRFAAIGALALIVAAVQQWHGIVVVPALLLLALAFAAADHPLNRRDGRWYAALAWLAAVVHLLGDDLQRRAPSDPAFIGQWPLALWGVVAVAAVLAAGLWRRDDERPAANISVPLVLWVLAGVFVFFGVTGEIERYFTLQSTSGSASLASQLSVSAWWLAFAAMLVLLGFGREVKAIRWAGLIVAGIAGLKVIVADLSSLDALWRVASVFLLGLVSLALAYLYHRRARS